MTLSPWSYSRFVISPAASLRASSALSASIFFCLASSVWERMRAVSRFSLAPAICSHVRPGGMLALSGILAEQSDELIAAYSPYLALSVADTRDGWVCLAGTKAEQ